MAVNWLSVGSPPCKEALTRSPGAAAEMVRALRLPNALGHSEDAPPSDRERLMAIAVGSLASRVGSGSGGGGSGGSGGADFARRALVEAGAAEAALDALVSPTFGQGLVYSCVLSPLDFKRSSVIGKEITNPRGLALIATCEGGLTDVYQRGFFQW
jgi:hypothetical protein